MSLSQYKKKRNFKITSEPSGKHSGARKFRFVVQRHQASHLHYDFRLELGGVLKSWAVPKGPSVNPAQKRLAVMVEDHPVDYIGFSGSIPAGNYGAGKVEIWDAGNFEPIDAKHQKISENAALAALKKGELKFSLSGKKLKGEFVLVRLKDGEKNWLLIKHKDEFSSNTVYNAEDHTRNGSAPKAAGGWRHANKKKLAKFIHPMLASVTKTPFDDKDWIFEIKWDGYRAIAETGNTSLKFYSRNGIDFSDRFPVIAQSLRKIKHQAVLDGEIILLNDKGLPDFQRLQKYEENLDKPLVYYVFDLLELNGKSLLDLPLLDRKKILKKLLKADQVIRYCDHIAGKGMAFLAGAKEKGLEGILAKNKESRYTPGLRSKEWLKIKNVQSTEVVIAGYTAPKGSRDHFGSLIVAGKNGKDWKYRGHVGTGFPASLLNSLKQKMKKLEVKSSPFKKIPPLNGEVTWLKPKLVADIAYTEITRDGIFRHPVFLRLREEKMATALNEEIPQASTVANEENEIRVGNIKVAVTNRHKIFWPEEGYTKGDVIDYYNRMSSFLLPHLKDRPLSLKRNPNGIRDEGFFHKDAGEHVPAFVDVFKVKNESKPGRKIDYIVCNNKATLIYLANLGCIEMNPWNSSRKNPDSPSWMVIDIDPSKENKFSQVVDVALMTKEILDKASIASYCKTSGVSGLHVYIPMKNKYDYEIVRNFARIVASLVQEQLPKFTTLERSLSKRGPKIYIDFLQNRGGQTLAAAYSLRPVPGASVSTPLDWKEVNHQLHPSQFTIQNIYDRVKAKGDLFRPVLTGTSNISKALKILEK